MKLPLLAASCFLVALPCFALEDTPENRATEADRYLVATPPKEMFADMAATMAQNMPEAQRAQFVTILTEKLDLKALEKAMKESMVKTFTADELKALADFYSSPEGRSSMKKYGAYMSDLMPVIQKEMQRAMAASMPGATPGR